MIKSHTNTQKVGVKQDTSTSFHFHFYSTSTPRLGYYPRFQTKCTKLLMWINAFFWTRVRKVHQSLKKRLRTNFSPSTTPAVIYTRMIPKSTSGQPRQPLYLGNLSTSLHLWCHCYHHSSNLQSLLSSAGSNSSLALLISTLCTTQVLKNANNLFSQRLQGLLIIVKGIQTSIP